MSCFREIEYKMMPTQAYTIIRNCSVCGGKAFYGSSENFRVNANGKNIDVWLIYQCKKCKHTYNLSLYHRYTVKKIPTDLYQRFLENDKALAMEYGTDKTIFAKNKAEIDVNEIAYEIRNNRTQILATDEQGYFQIGDVIKVENPCNIKVRIDKIASEIFHLTRNKVKQLENSNRIEIKKEILTQKIVIHLNESLD